MAEVNLEKHIKSKDLKDPLTRLSLYFNSDLIQMSVKGEHFKANEAIFNKKNLPNQKPYSGLFRTHEVLIVGFFFCKHFGNYEEKEDEFWALINPYQTPYVSLDEVEVFL